MLARLQDVDFGVYLVDDLLVKTDRASMAHSLEARVPFLDPLVANLALALPTRLKVRGLAKKVLLRKAVEPLLPRRDRARAQARLLDPRGGLAARRARAVRARDPRRRNLRARASSAREPVARLLDEHVAGREDWSRQLWGLLAFTLWYERHVEQGRRGSELGADGGAARHEGLDRHHGVRRTCSSSGRWSRSCAARGDEVEITARDYAQTLQLLELHGLEADAVRRPPRRPVPRCRRHGR